VLFRSPEPTIAKPAPRRTIEGGARRAATAPTPPAKRARKGRWMLAGLGLLVVVGVAAGYSGGDSETDTPPLVNTEVPDGGAVADATIAPPTPEAEIATPVESLRSPANLATNAPDTAETPAAAMETEVAAPVGPEVDLGSAAPAEETVTTAPSAAPSETPDLPAAADAAAAPEETGPSVDVIRVKSDGSAVLAGRGPANTDWIVMHNDSPLGVVTINQFGEWVYLPTQSLPSGTHEFSLVRKNPESKVVLPPVQKSGAEASPTNASPEVPLQPKPIGPDASIDEPANLAPIPVLRPREKLS